MEYFPAEANPEYPFDAVPGEDYLTVAILPMFPPEITITKILLVDGDGGETYDYATCMAAEGGLKPLGQIYGETLRDAGYCYDKYDINGAGNNVHLHPVEYDDYDAVISQLKHIEAVADALVPDDE